MLKIQGLKKRFGNFEALSGLDMEVEEGALYGFVGPNGAGKTTAIRIITGLLKADEGTVMIGGKDAFLYREQVKSEFGYVPDEFVHPRSTFQVQFLQLLFESDQSWKG